MSRGSDEAVVRCSTCGGTWMTSARNERRIIAGEVSAIGPCCRRPDVKVDEKHLVFWLRAFGCELKGRTAAQYVKEEGLPAGFREMADDLEDFCRAKGV